MKKQHNYELTVKWTGNNGTGTSEYKAYERSYSILTPNKPEILASSDPAFRGDPTKHNPERTTSCCAFLVPHAVVSSFMFRSWSCCS